MINWHSHTHNMAAFNGHYNNDPTVWAGISTVLIKTEKCHVCCEITVLTLGLTLISQPFLFWVVLKHKRRQAGVVFSVSGGMSPTGRSTLLYEMPLFAFLNLRHEAFSPL